MAYAATYVKPIIAYYKGRTVPQCDVFLAPEVGKWIDVDGKISRIGIANAIVFSSGGQTVQCIFDESWKSRILLLSDGGEIKVTGKINTYQDGSKIALTDCELRD